MAFKKTAGRSTLVQPTGLPNFSGFKQAAASYNQIGELAYGIGLDDRKRQFNQLIRQAEIDGKTAGVVYDEQGNLTPLTNFDYAKAGETYADADQNQILATYRKAAVQTYVNAASNDINDAANKALIDNPNDPAGIRSSAQGYLQGIEGLDEEIYTALAPKVASAFTRVENQALAQQRTEEIEFAVSTGTKAYNQNATELGVLYAKSEGTNNPAQAQGIQDRIDELLGEQEDIKESLKANEVSQVTLDQMDDAQATVIAARVSQAAVERSYSLNGAAQTYTMINEMFREAQLNPDVDAGAMRDAMVASVNMMSQIDSAQTEQEKQVRASIYGGYRLSIVQDGTSIQTELTNPESPIHQLDESQITNLLLESEGRFAATKNSRDAKLESRWKNNKVKYTNNLKVLQNPDVSDVFSINEAFREIEMLASFGQMGPESPGLLIEAKEAHRVAIQSFMAKGVDQTGSAIQLELGALSSYSQPPSFFTNPDYIDGLERSGVIGEKGYWSSRKAYINDVEGYAVKYSERGNKVRLARNGDLKLRNGQASSVSAAELSAMGEIMGFGKVSTQEGYVDINLLSDNEEVFAASSNAIAGFAIETGGLLHPVAKGFFKASMHSVENADRARRVMSQTMSAIRSDKKIDEDHVEGVFYSNLDSDTVAFLRTVNKFGAEIAVDMFSPKNKMSQNRTASVLASHPKYADMSEAEAFDQLFEDAFREGVEGRSFFKFLDPYITDDDDMMLKEMSHIGGVSNLEDMVITDPFIRDGMKKMFVAKMLGPGDYTPAEAVRDTLREIGTRLTPQYNPSNDKLELVSNSIIRDAQSTVGATGIVLDMNDVNRDIKNKFLADGNPYNIPESMIEELEKIDVAGRLYVNARIMTGPVLMYVPNEVYGGKQTYSVHIRTSAGKMEELLPAYRYDFQQTIGYESFQQAVDTLKSDKMKAFWGKFPFLDPNLVQPTFDALEKTRDDRTLNGLFSAYDKYIAGSRSNQLLSTDPIEPLNRDEIQEFYYMLERISSLGWR